MLLLPYCITPITALLFNVTDITPDFAWTFLTTATRRLVQSINAFHTSMSTTFDRKGHHHSTDVTVRDIHFTGTEAGISLANECHQVRNVARDTTMTSMMHLTDKTK